MHPLTDYFIQFCYLSLQMHIADFFADTFFIQIMSPEITKHNIKPSVHG